MADAQAIANALTAVLQPMVATITSATAAPVAPAAAAPQEPVAAIIFACTPAQAQADLLNYELPGDAKICASATIKLSATFSLNKPNVSILLAELGDRSNSASCTTTLQVSIALTNSVDKDTKSKMQREKSEYMTGVAGDVPSGMLYFKKLMMKAEVDSSLGHGLPL
jgi:hypothetical protein